MVLATIIVSCSSENSMFYEFESEILNDYLMGVEKQIIEIESTPTVLTLNEENLLYPEDVHLNLFVSNLFGIHAFNENLVVNQLNNETALLLDENGKKIRPLFQEGSGPFEIRRLSGLAVNRGRLYVADFSQMIVHRSDSNLVFDTTIPLDRANTTSNHQSFTACGSYLYVPLGLDSEHILELIETKPETQVRFEVFPKIIGPGYGHQAHNTLHLSCRDEKLLANLIGLPYLFLFNAGESKPEQVLIIESESFKQLNKDVRPVNEPQYRTGSSIRVRHVLTAIHLGKSGKIYTTHNGNLLIIGKNEGSEWRVLGEYVLEVAGSEERVAPIGITTTKEHIYVIHPQHEFIVKLEKDELL